MAGRIDFAHLEQLAGGSVAPLLQNATGSAYWYLVLKNYVAASGVHPKAVIVFFRDTNLTDPLFPIGDSGPRHLDEVAHDDEPGLAAAVAPGRPMDRVHRAIDRLYAADEAVHGWSRRSLLGRGPRGPLSTDRCQRVNELFLSTCARCDGRHRRRRP